MASPQALQDLEACLRVVPFGPQGAPRVRGDVAALLATDLVDVRCEAKTVPREHASPQSSALACCLAGTLGIRYHGTVYNIPCEVYLVPGYPALAPLMVVTPTPDMLIRRGHPNVDQTSGRVLGFEYLDAWTATHTLVELCTIAASIFSSKPPLFAKPPKDARRAVVEPPRSRVETPTTAEPPPPYAAVSSESSAAVTVEASSSAKDRLTKKLQDMLRAYFEEERRAIDAELATQARLEHARAHVAAQRKPSEAKEDVVDAAAIRATNDALAKWTHDLEHSAEPTASLDTRDALSAQLLAKLAESNAIDDVLFALDEFLYQKRQHVDLDTFLHDVRRLTNSQFLLKAHLLKIYNAIDAHHATPSSDPAAGAPIK